MPLTPAYAPTPEFDALGADFSDPVEPADFPEPRLRAFDAASAKRLGLAGLDADERLAMFARFAPLPDNLKQPLAMRYHGHQFRVYNPQIGDGRGFLFAQLADADGRPIDLGTKGSGRTPWSRDGDGRMTLQSGVREVLAARFLAAVGVPSCAILALVETGERLHRYDEPAPARGAVLTRAQGSLVRIGTFQRHAYEGRADNVARLLDYAIARHHPSVRDEKEALRPAAFFDAVVDATATLVGRWLAAGFVHGVLNSDNMTITGESFDYGPFRFLSVYSTDFTAAYFDQAGLYAYGRQAEAAAWNLARLAESLALLAPIESFAPALERFGDQVRRAKAAAFAARLGVAPRDDAARLDLMDALIGFLRVRKPSFEGVVFDWFGGAASARRALDGPRAQHYRGQAFDAFRAALFAADPVAPERLEHAYCQADGPVTLTIDQVRAAWFAIEADDDWTVFEALISRIDAMGDAYAVRAT